MHVDVPRETAERLTRLPGREGQVARQALLEPVQRGVESAAAEPKLAESASQQNLTEPGETHALERTRQG
jgi:hypothetical protein